MATPIGSLRVNLETNLGKFSEDLAKAGGSVRKLDKGFGQFGRRVGGLGKQITAGVAVPMVGMGIAAVTSSESIEKALRTIEVGTGASGDALAGLGDSFRSVFTEVPESADQVAQAIADLNTVTGATGPILEKLTKHIFDASRVLGEDGATNAKSFATALNQFGEPAERGAELLDQFFKVAQTTGASLSKLTEQTNTYGAVLANAGFSMAESAAIFGSFEKVGIAVSRVMPGLNKAFRTWAGENKDIQKTLAATIRSMERAGSESEALTIATAAFGAEGAQRMTAAVRQGVFSLDNLQNALSGSTDAVVTATNESRTFSETLQVLKNKATIAFEPLGNELKKGLMTLVPVVEDLAAKLTVAVKWFQNLSPATQKLIVVGGLLVAALGPILMIVGQISLAVPALVFAFKSLGIVLAAIASPIGLAVAAIVGIGYVIYTFRDQVWEVIDSVVEGFSSIPEFLGRVKDYIAEKLQAIVGTFGWLYDKLIGNSIIPDIESEGIAAFSGLADGMASESKRGADAVSKEFQQLQQTLTRSDLPGKVSDLARAFASLEPAIRRSEQVRKRYANSLQMLASQGADLTDQQKRLVWWFQQTGHELSTNVNVAFELAYTRHLPQFYDGVVRIDRAYEGLNASLVDSKGKFLSWETSGLKAIGTVEGFANGIKSSFSNLLEGITGGKGLGGFMNNLGSGLVDGFGLIISGGISSLVQTGVSMATTGIKKFGNWLKGKFGPSAAQELRSLSSRMWGVGLSEPVIKILEKTSKAVGDDFTALLLRMTDIVKTSGGVMAIGFQTSARMARDLFMGVEDGAITTEQAIGQLRPILSELAKNFDGAGIAGKQQFAELIQLANRMGFDMAQIVEIVGDKLAKQALGMDLSNAIVDARNKFHSLRQEIEQMPQRIPIQFDIGNLGSDEGGFHIPGFADGGIVRRPTIALIGEAGPEAVIPLSDITGGSAIGGSAGVENKLDRIERLLLRQPDNLARATRDAMLLAMV